MLTHHGLLSLYKTIRLLQTKLLDLRTCREWAAHWTSTSFKQNQQFMCPLYWGWHRWASKSSNCADFFLLFWSICTEISASAEPNRMYVRTVSQYPVLGSEDHNSHSKGISTKLKNFQIPSKQNSELVWWADPGWIPESHQRHFPFSAGQKRENDVTSSLWVR